MKVDGSLARNIDFEVANLEVHKKTRRKTSIINPGLTLLVAGPRFEPGVPMADSMSPSPACVCVHISAFVFHLAMRNFSARHEGLESRIPFVWCTHHPSITIKHTCECCEVGCLPSNISIHAANCNRPETIGPATCTPGRRQTGVFFAPLSRQVEDVFPLCGF